ncbi:MAG: hypothetical protein LUQ16_02120 [Methanomassiliicoccales archaeon]|nr:hypothetical protein [Methanomassiliicoccales archaeon]MDD1755247.1 hypothetical protein [Methanomassiliicoccales archaeon]
MVIRSILALSTVFLLGLMLAAPMVSATAEAPTWNEGDVWAMGKTVDLDAEFATQLQDLEDMISNMPNPQNLVLNEFEVQALASAYVLFKVDSVNETEARLKGSYAVKFTGDASISVTADMSKPGSYAWSDEVPTEQRTVSADVSIDMATVLEIEVVLVKDTAAIKSITISVKASMVGSADLVNIPNEQSNWTTRTIAYDNYDVSADINVFMSVTVDFQPALNLYDFPLSVDDEWVIESTATMSGSYGGVIDINGLPANVESDLFSNEMLQDAGIDSFPIDLAQAIQNNDEPTMNDGVIGPESVVIGPKTANCISVEQVTLPNQGLVSKYTIRIQGEGDYYYIDGVDWLTSMQDVANEMGMIEDLPVDVPINAEMLSMDSVPASEAEQGIQDIADYRAQIAGESTSDGGSDSGMLMILLVVAIAAVALIAVAFLLLKKKPKAP